MRLLARTRPAAPRRGAADPLTPGDEHRALVEASNDVAWTAGADRRLRYVSARARAVVGTDPDVLVGRDFLSLVAPGNVEATRAAFERVLAGEEVFGHVIRIRRSDGRVLAARANAVPVRDEAGKIVGVAGATTDMSTLRTAEERFRLAFEESRTALAIGSLETGRYLQVNRRFCELVGRPEEELLGTTFSAITHPAYHAEEQEARRRMLAGDAEFHRGEKRFLRADGEEVWAERTASALHDDEGRPVEVLVQMVDVTERRRGEARLREAEERFRLAFDEAPAGMAIVAPDGRWIRVNAALASMVGRSVAELEALSFADLTHPDDVPRDFEFMRAALAGERRSTEHEKRYVHRDGHVVWAQIRSVLLRDRDHRPLHFVTQMLDITERKRAEESLRRVAAAVEFSGEAIYTHAPDGRVLTWNPGAERLFGYSSAEARELSVRDLFPPERADAEAALLAAVLAGATHRDHQTERVRSDGSRVSVSITRSPVRDERGAVVAVTTIARDIGDRLRAEHERREMEARLRHAERLESVGQLAGGVAHDFNNLLAVILNYASFALEDLPSESPVREDVLEIEAAARRAADLTRRLLTFSRRSPASVQDVDLRELLERVLRLLERTLGENVELRARLADDLGTVVCDPAEAEQIVLNLAINARDAMPRGGVLALDAREVELDGETAARFGVEPGRFGRIAVADTGCGIAPELLERVFEPFFTTKPPGTGTGLGLATVYGAAKAAGGHVEVESAEGRGSTFRVYLPAGGVPGGGAVAAPERPVAALDGEHVLLVEDDEAVARAAARMLRGAGLSVTTAADGEVALALLEGDERGFDLLVTDVMMPGMSGIDLARRAAGVPVVFISGYSSAVAAAGVVEARGPLLAKPFEPDELIEAVSAALGSR